MQWKCYKHTNAILGDIFLIFFYGSIVLMYICKINTLNKKKIAKFLEFLDGRYIEKIIKFIVSYL